MAELTGPTYAPLWRYAEFRSDDHGEIGMLESGVRCSNMITLVGGIPVDSWITGVRY